MKNIVLIGMMGCGKSTIGALLSEKLGRKLVDTDELIVEREGRSIPEIFSAEGEEYFRSRELDVARELGQKEDLVIACGGGLPLHPGSIAPLKKSGEVFWLCRDPGETYDSMDTTGRPLAQQGREDFLARFAQREPIYQAWADHMIIDFSSPEKTCNAILEVLK
ncbi:MAG: shikimate kinase [Oscillospiraceae bacterium]